MILSHLDSDAERDHAIVGDIGVLYPAPVSDIEAVLRLHFAEAPAQMLRGLLIGSDDEYLEWIVEQLQLMGKVPFAMIGELQGEDWDRVRTLEMRSPNGREPNVTYDLANTPCYNVVGRNACIYPAGVAQLFAKDDMLVHMGVESYVGVPLFDPGGRPLGLVALLDTLALDEPRMRETLGLILAFRPRIETVLINRRARRDWALLSGRIAAPEHGDPLGQLMGSFALAMQVRGAFVSRFVDGSRQRLRTAALVVDGQLRDAIEYAPLAEVELAGEVLIRDALALAWPGAEALGQFGASSYLVSGLTGADGQLIGHLGLMHDRPLNRRIGDQPVVRAFKQQVTFDLRRAMLEAERRATERRLLELQRTESLGLLAGGVAHDFNNLLVGMLGNVELALLDHLGSGAGSGSGAAMREYLVDIRDAARSAMQLCRQMLTYAGRAEVEVTRFDLVAELDELRRLLAASISRTIEIVVRRESKHSWIDGDPIQIRQLLMNLITNAADAIGQARGRIEVVLRTVSVTNAQPIVGVTGALAPGSYICLGVRDDGCGMAKSTLERMFDPFFSTKPSGHGLGLAPMLGVVRAHRGTVVVSSEFGVGTDFRVYLPEAQTTET
ncbi:sensory box histidine kinase/response regulator [Enhygromyxa salina]|uniref:histidine kinase n=1 Tax=Enhygromyxa salina TaxID=215803 RepID=A0A0C1ZP77_9BACT|nr:ATP-binding protein [Enhygromyxa salina]KIG19379.1 sensory box histidine kinase/response regulator [Enhygromyxa salina]